MSDLRFLLSAFVLFALLLAADVAWFAVLRGSDHHVSDALLRAASKSHPPDPDIVMLVADDRSVAILGEEVDRWPWPREVFGEVARYVAAQKPAARTRPAPSPVPR